MAASLARAPCSNCRPSQLALARVRTRLGRSRNDGDAAMRLGSPKLVRRLTIVALLVGCALAAQTASAYTLKTLYSFCDNSDCKEDRAPNAGLLRDAQGNLYGTTFQGGSGDGVVFKLVPNADKSKWSLKVIHAFCAACGDGQFPESGLTYAGHSSGALYDGVSPLYGAAATGGAGSGGILFELT